jgi:hypothetical protein
VVGLFLRLRLDSGRPAPHLSASPSSPYPVSLPPRYLAQRLTEALPTTDRGVLHTIGDAITYMTALPEHREMKNTWQHACKLILNCAPAEQITRQLSLTLFMDKALDLVATRIHTKRQA